MNRGVYLIPREFSVEAYTNLLEIPGLTSSIGIAFARTILGTLLTLMCCSFAAYILANRDLPCRKLLYRFFIITMYVNAGFIPYYLLISNIKLKNNFLVYILPYAVQAYFIILIKTYIESIPGELVESAEMDGGRPGEGVFPDHPAAGEADSGMYCGIRRGESVEYLVG